jgi:WD40 repeat protein
MIMSSTSQFPRIFEFTQSSRANAILFIPGTRSLVSGGDNPYLWSLDQPHERGDLKGTDKAIVSICWDASTKTIITGDFSCITGWDVRGKRLFSHTAHDSWIYSLSIAAKKRHLASIGNDGLLRIWNLRDFSKLDQKSFNSMAEGICYSPDEETLAVASGKKVVILDGRNLKAVKTLSGHKGQVRSVCFVPSDSEGSGGGLVSGAYDGRVLFWDTATGEAIQEAHKHNGRVWSVSVSADRRYVASAGWDGCVALINPTSRRIIANIQTQNEFNDCVSFSDDSQFLACSGNLGTIEIWRV